MFLWCLTWFTYVGNVDVVLEKKKNQCGLNVFLDIQSGFCYFFFRASPLVCVLFLVPLKLAGKSYQTRRYPDHTWHVIVGQHRDRHVVLLLQETHV